MLWTRRADGRWIVAQINFATNLFTHKSMLLLSSIDFRLAAIVMIAAAQWQKDTGTEIRVTSGKRTEEEQRALLAAGATKTMKSHHRDGRAVDLAIIREGKAVWELEQYRRLDRYMQAASLIIGLDEGDLVWGGHWTTLRDGPHWQLMLPPVLAHVF